jgi:hypothetical protein
MKSSLAMSMAQRNLSRWVLEKIFSTGTSYFLHQATEILAKVKWFIAPPLDNFLPWIQIVQLGCAQGNLFVFILNNTELYKADPPFLTPYLVGSLRLQLLQLLLDTSVFLLQLLIVLVLLELRLHFFVLLLLLFDLK